MKPALRLPGAPGERRAVLIAHPAEREAIARWTGEVAGDRVTLLLVTPKGQAAEGRDGIPAGDDDGDDVQVRTASDRRSLVHTLAQLGPLDLVVNLLSRSQLPRGASDQLHLFEHAFFHLAHRGVYVLDRQDAGEETDPAELSQWRELRRAVVAGHAATTAGTRRDFVVRHLKTLRVGPETVVARKRGRHYLKLREDQLDELLPEREPGLTVSYLDRRPGGSFEVRSEITSYGQPPDDETWPERIEFPATSVRRYDGPMVSATHQLLATGHTLLPDSFRWPTALPLDHPKVISATPLMCRLKEDLTPQRTLRGSYYYLDCLFPGHFGHLTTEALSRLWGWDIAKRENPDLKALFHIRPHKGMDGTLERALYTAYGIPAADLVATDRPVALESVVSVTPLWQNKEPHYAHPGIMETWRRMSEGLLQGEPPGTHDKLFVSRGPDLSHRRGCRNQVEVERAFAARGFHVFYPEYLPLSQQVALFAGARVVAGFGGSAMFNLMHSRRLERVIVMSHDNYLARNEQLYASLFGAQLDYFWSPADVRPADASKATELVRSPWAFDFERLGADLDRVLATA